MMAPKLRFTSGRSNSKLRRWNKLYTYSMRAGHDCPFANECRSSVVVEDGKAHIVDGENCTFRCFGATCEIRSRSLRVKSTHNGELIRTVGLNDVKALTSLIDRSIPEDARIVRVHASGGDFMTEAYMQAWMNVAELYPDVLFYGYTKALPYVVKLKDIFPSNFKLTPSRGGTCDHLIDERGLNEARVVFHPSEAEALGWQVDHDDSHAMQGDHSFCLIVHGTQPAGSDAAKATSRMRKEGVKYGYSAKAAKKTRENVK